MTQAPGKRPRSALSQGADGPPETIEEDWRRRGRLLLDQLLGMAAQDDALARSMIDELARFASAQPGMAKRLRAATRDAGTCKKRGARATPHWQQIMLLDRYELGVEGGRTHEDMRSLLARDFNVSPRTIDNRLSKARKSVKPSERLIHELRKTS